MAALQPTVIVGLFRCLATSSLRFRRRRSTTCLTRLKTNVAFDWIQNLMSKTCLMSLGVTEMSFAVSRVENFLRTLLSNFEWPETRCFGLGKIHAQSSTEESTTFLTRLAQQSTSRQWCLAIRVSVQPQVLDLPGTPPLVPVNSMENSW